MEVMVPKSGKRYDTPRMAAIRVAPRGVGVNTCPYGCTDVESGEHGYCYHVVGSTVPGSKTVMEPMGWDKGGRRCTNAGFDGAGKPVVRGRQRVLPTDHVEMVTVSGLVYRKDAPKPKTEDDLFDVLEAEEKELAEMELEEKQLAGKA